MTYSFQEAKKDWDRLQQKFITDKDNKSSKRVAERIEILLTVPKGTEQEFKDLAKLRRQQADINMSASVGHMALALEFERLNPPPKRSDYE